MDERIIVKNVEGSVGIISPSGEVPIEYVAANDVPAGLEYEVVDVSDIPSDRTFRMAWKHDATLKVDIDMPKAKEITHGRRRIARDKEMEPFDEVIAKQIPGSNSQAAEASRAQLRTKYETMQNDIDACGSADELLVLIGSEGI